MNTSEPTKQLTKEQAIALYNSKEWENWTPEQMVRFQLFQRKLCVPFHEFHKAIEIVLKRSVWTHEFANCQDLMREYLGQSPAPTFDEIIDMIPAEKRIILNF